MEIRTIKQIRLLLTVLLLPLLLATPSVWAGDGNETAPESAPPKFEPLPEQGEQPSWFDRSQRYVANSSDAMADWIDHFFGAPRSDLEAADSTLRLITSSRWEGGTDEGVDMRLRGNVHLPRLSQRLSLVFADEEDDEPYPESDLPLLEDRNNTNAALQYNVREKQGSRLDLKLGLSSNIKLKASARYRYELPWRDKLINRFTETVYFRDGEGFGSRSELDHDWLVGDRGLLRWSNSGTFAEEKPGVSWTSRLKLSGRLNERSALSGFTWISGETRPQYLTESYGVGMRYRRNFYRRWLYYELEPAYAWRRPDIDSERHGGWLVTARLEILFERKQ